MIVELYQDDCRNVLPKIETASIDAFITDPPYPHIKRDYGYWTLEEWWELIVKGVVPEVRRILRPTGSAVFILQPNSEKTGKMRGWLWEFMVWLIWTWNIVQDIYWWNPVSIPTAETTSGNLPRSSVKTCVWCGPTNCYRDLDNVLWAEAQANKARYAQVRARTGPRKHGPSGQSYDMKRMGNSAEEKGGVSPYNMLPFANSNYSTSAGAHGHGAGTPLAVADWWTRYICPPGGTVCDPFMGSGTMGVAAVQNGCGFIGIEQMPGQGYFATAQERIEQERNKPHQMELY